VNSGDTLRINTGTVKAGCPVWSPDGKWMLFVSGDYGTEFEMGADRNVYVVNADGSTLTQVTYSDEPISSASWSPDGTQIVFTMGAIPQLNLMNADGSNMRRLELGQYPEGYVRGISRTVHPSWSPDGKRIVFSSNPPTKDRTESLRFSLFVVDLVSLQPMRLSDDLTLDYAIYEEPVDLRPMWSPDGEWIAYYTKQIFNGDGQANLYKINVTGSHNIQLTNDSPPIQNLMPAWSPDGSQIAFVSNRDHTDSPNTFNIYLMNADGSNISRLTNGGHDTCPAWRP
jgi:TolB protein